MAAKKNVTEKTTRQFPTPSNQAPESNAPQALLRIVTWRATMDEASFYVQSKGLHAGRVLTKPIANCFAVYTNIDHLREVAFCIYASDHLRTRLYGSVVPFLRIAEYRKILTHAAIQATVYDRKHLQTLLFLDQQIESLATKLELFRQYQTLLAYKINVELKIFPIS